MDCGNSRFLDRWENSLIGSVSRERKGKVEIIVEITLEDLCEETSSSTECGTKREFCLCVF